MLLCASAQSHLDHIAEGVGFEPTEACTSTVFKTAAFNRSATPPHYTRIALGWSYVKGPQNASAHPFTTEDFTVPFFEDFCSCFRPNAIRKPKGHFAILSNGLGTPDSQFLGMSTALSSTHLKLSLLLYLQVHSPYRERQMIFSISFES